MRSITEIDWLAKITNPYERKARLYPVMLALIPPSVLIICLYGFTPKLENGLIGLVASFGTFYLMTSVARELGKRLEKSLFESWGGKPTTQILRHRDQTIDPVTKERYHNFLAKQLNIKFPSVIEEQSDAIAADNVYQSGIQWLLDKTRDTKKFALLFQENIAYGFRRNCLGLKSIAITIACASFVWPLISENVLSLKGFDLAALMSAPKSIRWSLAASLTMLFTWCFFITEKTVKTAAFTYANMLLRACDALPKRK